ncbi:nuclear transport factor 2 family protein [Streptomyces sp. NPDC091412]|uniref:nuclear transport factor 2 family protein n=1 Tax=Streptomyces sp. NPDC091412 TaxID=3366002 RepID=UPI003819EF88
MDTTEHLVERLARAVDDLEIRRVITDYAAFVDAREWEGLAGILADEVVADYHNGRTVVTGARAMVDYIRDNTAHLAWQHHMIAPYGVDVAGDRATAQAYLVSHQMLKGDPSHVLMMAATYDLEFDRGERDWVLSRMIHTIKVANHLPITTAPPNSAAVPPAVSH